MTIKRNNYRSADNAGKAKLPGGDSRPYTSADICDITKNGQSLSVLRFMVPYTVLVAALGQLSFPESQILPVVVQLPTELISTLTLATSLGVLISGLLWTFYYSELAARAKRDALADDAKSTGCGVASLVRIHRKASIKSSVNVAWALSLVTLAGFNELQSGLFSFFVATDPGEGSMPDWDMHGVLYLTTLFHIFTAGLCMVLVAQARAIQRRFDPTEELSTRMVETYLRAAQSRKDQVEAKRQAREIIEQIRKGFFGYR